MVLSLQSLVMDPVVTWGFETAGGDRSAVQDQLKDVQQIQATYGAFAAILGDGSRGHLGL